LTNFTQLMVTQKALSETPYNCVQSPRYVRTYLIFCYITILGEYNRS